MLIEHSPLGLSVQANCVTHRPLPDACDPCYFLTKFLPRIISPSKKDNTVLRELFKAAIAPLQDFSSAICGFCATAETDDCACLDVYYTLIGAPRRFAAVNADACLTPTMDVVIDVCGTQTTYKQHCAPLCETCDTVVIDCDTNFELMKKIARVFPRWSRMTATAKNISDALTEWYGRECFILSEKKGLIYWSSGQELSKNEKQELSIVYQLLPVAGGVNLTHVWS